MIKRTAVEIANEIRFLQNERSTAILLVEGRDDKLLMEKFIDRGTCRIIVAQGKEQVEQVLRIVDAACRTGVLGIVDADFDRIEGRKGVSQNIVMPDGHDIETMMMRSPAIDSIWIEFGSAQKVNSFDDTFELIDDIARRIGCLRLHSLRSSLNLRFNGMRVTKFIDRRSMQFDQNKFVQEIKDLSQRHDLDDDQLISAMIEIDNEGHDNAQLANGSDLVAVFSHGLRSAFGTNDASKVSDVNLRRLLRSAFHHSDFQKSQLFQQIRQWESDSRDFMILD